MPRSDRFDMVASAMLQLAEGPSDNSPPSDRHPLAAPSRFSRLQGEEANSRAAADAFPSNGAATRKTSHPLHSILARSLRSLPNALEQLDYGDIQRQLEEVMAQVGAVLAYAVFSDGAEVELRASELQMTPASPREWYPANSLR